MIRIKIGNAANLPLNGQNVKTKLYFFSLSSLRFLNFTTQCTGNGVNACFDTDFYVPFFRCRYLSFTIYSSKFLKNDTFLGRVDIDFFKFLCDNSIESFFSSASYSIKHKFQITSCKSDSYLTLEFSFIPEKYNPISFEKIKSPFFHVYSTYSPPLPPKYSLNPELPVEIELFQAFPLTPTAEDRKNRIKNGIYFTLTKENSWDEIGSSTMNNIVPCPSGITQVHTFQTHLINNKTELFILNVSNYCGTVTLNFVGDEKGKNKSFPDGEYFVSKSSDDTELDRFHTIDIQVERNKKYVVPFFIYYMFPRLFGGKTINNFPILTFDKSTQFSEASFQTQLLSELLKINTNWNEYKFFRAIVIPSSQKVSLLKILNEFHLPSNMNLKLYVGGSAKNYQNNVTLSGYWTPFFIVFDSKSGRRCEDIEKSLVSPTNMRNCNPAVNYMEKQIYGFVWTFSVDLNLDSIDSNKMIVLCVKTGAKLENCSPPGSLTILDAHNGTLLLRKQITVNAGGSRFGTFLRFMFSEDGWDIFPMFKFFPDVEKMNFYVDSLHRNNWNAAEQPAQISIGTDITELNALQ